MNLPSLRDWIFSLKTFIAGMLALYIAFYFDLSRPYWALASVYIVSNPFVGATRSKALYRVLGTTLGVAEVQGLVSLRDLTASGAIERSPASNFACMARAHVSNVSRSETAASSAAAKLRHASGATG